MTLEDKMKKEVLECQRNCTYMKDGYDKQGYMVHYCTYYFPESRRNDFECAFKGNLVDISKHFFVTNTYYKCMNSKRRTNGQRNKKNP